MPWLISRVNYDCCCLNLCRERWHHIAVTCSTEDAPLGTKSSAVSSRPPCGTGVLAPAVLRAWEPSPCLLQLALPYGVAPPSPCWWKWAQPIDPAGAEGAAASSVFAHFVCNFNMVCLQGCSHQTATNPSLNRYSGLSQCAGVSAAMGTSAHPWEPEPGAISAWDGESQTRVLQLRPRGEETLSSIVTKAEWEQQGRLKSSSEPSIPSFPLSFWFVCVWNSETWGLFGSCEWEMTTLLIDLSFWSYHHSFLLGRECEALVNNIGLCISLSPIVCCLLHAVLF